MTQIKSFTSLEQSKKLAEILPLESADMHYHYDFDFDELESIPTITEEDDHFILFPNDVRCWSLTALLSVLPDDCGIDKEDRKYVASYIISDECGSYTEDNPIDACVVMIEYLHENKLL